MRAVIQRVREASVRVNGRVTGAIDRGLVVYIGVERGDTPADVEWVAAKISGVRIFPDADGKMNIALADLDGPAGEVRGMLAISQFTLHGDMRKGRRPSYASAAQPDLARQLYEMLIATWRSQGHYVATGVFGSHMDVVTTNDGPVTLILDSAPPVELKKELEAR